MPEYIADEKQSKNIMTDFFVSYAEKSESLSDKDWLENKLSKYFPEKFPQETENFCEELFQTQNKLDALTEEICNETNSEYRSEIWMYKKLLMKFNEGNEKYFENLCMKDEILTEINIWPAQVSEHFHYKNFFRRRINKNAQKNFLTKGAVGNSLNKSIFNQFQRTVKTDLGHIDLRGKDFD